MVSFGTGGSSKQKSSGESGTRFPKNFLDKTYKYFGKPAEYNPEFVGFNDFDALERNLYGSAEAKATDAYKRTLGANDERLSMSGLLNSPNQYLRGGATEGIQQDYLANLQQAARDAALGRLGAQQEEYGRQTNFNVDTATKLYQQWLSQIQIALNAGKYGKNSSSGSSDGGFNFGISDSSANKLFG